MKKLFAVLFCAFAVAGSAFAKELSYEIDPVATAKAPWKVGERIVEEGSCEGDDYYLEFLGVTQSGQVLVQEFYLSGEKLSNPFLKTVVDAEKETEGLCPKSIEGNYTRWYKSGKKRGENVVKDDKGERHITEWYENGQKKAEINVKNSKRQGLVTQWYENGQKGFLGFYKNGRASGIQFRWDKKGNLIGLRYFDTSED